jgi:hypothetical protein
MAKQVKRKRHPWTSAEYRKFKQLVDLAGSLRQMDRITARLEMPKFIERVGKEKCDLMFAFMCRNDKRPHETKEAT